MVGTTGLPKEVIAGEGLVLLPIMAQPIVVTYNLPSLEAANQTLVPTFEIVVRVLLLNAL